MDSPQGRGVLIATVLGSGMTMLDSTVVNVALPHLGRDLHSDFAGLQWVVNGYMLPLAALILVGGAVGDRWGRRRAFVIGVIWFTVASMACALAPSLSWLIVARAAQGVGGALLTPGSLAIIQSSFDPDDRGRAIGAWSGLGGVATAFGPLLGGWIVGVASWRWIFVLNIPLGIAAAVIALRAVPETRSPTVPERVDVVGATLGTIGLGLSTYGLIERAWPTLGLGVVVMLAFVVSQAVGRHSMLPLSMFRSSTFSATNTATFVVWGGFGAALFFLVIVLQDAMGYSALESGLATFPVTALLLVFSARVGALAQRIGPRWPMTVGPMVMAVGLALFTRVTPGRSYWSGVFVAVVVFAAGLTVTVAPVTSTALASADANHSGLASGVNNAVARAGQLIAVAAIPLVAGFRPGEPVSSKVLVTGFHRVALGAAIACVVGAVLSWCFVSDDALKAPEPTAKPKPEPNG